MSSAIFDEKISDYITIVRTDFHHFRDKTDEAKQSRTREKNIIHDKLKNGGVNIVNLDKKIIFVNNPHGDEDTRKFSRETLRNYLTENCQDIYRPKGLNNLSEILRIEDMNSPEGKERVKSEIDKYYAQESQIDRLKTIDKIKEITGASASVVQLISTVLGVAVSVASCKIM